MMIGMQEQGARDRVRDQRIERIVELEEQAPADQEQAAYAPPPADAADELEHLGQLHESGVLTDEEFATAKAKTLGT